MGAMSGNQVALAEGLPEYEGGEARFIPMNLTPLDQGLKSAELDNEVKEQSLESDQDMPAEGEVSERISKLKFESLKGKFDAYGVAVRSGALTPQTIDEQRFRKEAGLPAMSKEVTEAWNDDGGVRRPITLQTPAQEEIEEAQAAKATSGESKQVATVTEQAAIAAYLPSMADSISRLTRKEQLNHESAAKKEPQQMKEALDKFYIKFEAELKDCLSDKLLFISQEICQLEKKENQADIIVEKLLNDIAEMSDAPKLGEIRQDEEGAAYTFTMDGWIEVDTVKK
jgi:hypothetical protein